MKNQQARSSITLERLVNRVLKRRLEDAWAELQHRSLAVSNENKTICDCLTKAHQRNLRSYFRHWKNQTEKEVLSEEVSRAKEYSLQ